MTTIDDGIEGTDTARKSFLARYSMTSFFLLAFGLTWGYFWLVWAPLGLPASLIPLGGFGPSIAAFVVLAVTSGKTGVIRLLRSMVQWRAGVQWYLFILLGIPILNLLAFLIIPGNLSDLVAPSPRLVQVYLTEIVFSLTIGIAPLWEEVGWRGFALPGMQRLNGPVMGTIILGMLWGVWHLPFFFGPLGQAGPGATFISASIALLEFSIGLTGVSVLMTWVLNNCRGSTLLAILFHAAFDSSGLALIGLFPSTSPHYLPVHYQTLGIAVVFSIAALAVIIVTRGDLSYQRYKREMGQQEHRHA